MAPCLALECAFRHYNDDVSIFVTSVVTGEFLITMDQ